MDRKYDHQKAMLEIKVKQAELDLAMEKREMTRQDHHSRAWMVAHKLVRENACMGVTVSVLTNAVAGSDEYERFLQALEGPNGYAVYKALKIQRYGHDN